MIRRHVQIDSTNIHSLGYDMQERTMEIVFKTDLATVYSFHKVPPEVFCEMLNAESVGQFFTKSIRQSAKYPYEKRVREDTLQKASTPTVSRKKK